MSGELLCIIPGPSHLYATDPDERETRWCFTCRKHVAHTWELWGDPPPSRFWHFADWDELDGYATTAIEPLVMPSYYDPEWRLRCPAGHSDTYFPGCGPL